MGEVKVMVSLLDGREWEGDCGWKTQVHLLQKVPSFSGG